jgi:Maf1 regulator
MKYLEDEKLTKLTSELTDAALGRSRSIHGRIEAYIMKRAGTDKKYAHALGERYVAEMETVESQLAEYKTFLERHAKLGDKQEEATSARKGRKRSMSTGSQLEATTSSNPKKQQRPRSNSFDTINSGPSGSANVGAAVSKKIGDFGEIGTRRLMTDLILTLNASFPDYDFASIKPCDFEKIHVSNAVRRINERFSEMAVEKVSFLSDLWNAMDDVVRLAECDVYSYAPQARDEDDDPLSFLTQTLIDSVDQQNDNSSVSSSTPTVLWSFNFFFVNKSLKRIVFFTCVERMRSEGSNFLDDDVSSVKFHGTEASDADFDLDPSVHSGGIPISIM